MRIEYIGNKIEKQCTDMRRAKKDFPEKIAIRLFRLITFVEAAENLESILNNPIYRFHDLKGDKEGFYAMDIDGKRGSYRLIVSFDSEITKKKVFSESMSIESIEIKEVSNHYE